MDCFNCKKQYNESERSPRLLIQCGHSICSKCTAELYRENQILCPECGQTNKVNNITNFPLNLALLNLKSNTQSINGAYSNSQITENCSKHVKRFEAFCENDQNLLCIKCILEDGYQQQQIESLDNAQAKQKNLLESVKMECLSLENQIKMNLNDICKSYVMFQQDEQKQLIEFQQFYQQIYQLIQEKENSLKGKLLDISSQNKKILQEKEQKLQNHLQLINQFHNKYNIWQQLDQCQFLKQTQQRNQLIQEINVQVEQFSYKPFETMLQIDKEINNINRILNQLKPETPQQQQQKIDKKPYVSSNQTHTNLYSKKTITAQNKVKKKETKEQPKKHQRKQSRDTRDAKPQLQKQTSNNINNINNNIPITLHFNLNNQQQPIQEVEGSPINVRKNLNNYQEMRNLMKQQLQLNNQDNFNQTPTKSINKSVSQQKNQQFHKSPSVVVQKQEMALIIKQKSTESLNTLNLNCSNFEEIQQSQRYQIQEQTMNNDLNSFLYETNQKNPNEISEICIKQCDISRMQQLINNYIYVVGGFVESPNCSIERLNTQTKQWEDVIILKNNRAKFQVIPLSNGNIFLMGGKQEGVRTALCEEYFLKENIIKPAKFQLTSSKSGFGAVSSKNDMIFVVGGNDGSSILNTLEVYDYSNDKLRTLSPMREKRDELAVTFGNDNKIYAIGGFGGSSNECLKTAERYNISLDKWEHIAPLNVPRRALCAVTLPDGIYAIGGFDGSMYLNSVEKYNINNNNWQFVKTMNFPRCTFSAVSSADCQNIYVLGGFDNGPLQSVEKYNVINDQWELQLPMKRKRFMHSSVAINN